MKLNVRCERFYLAAFFCELLICVWWHNDACNEEKLLLHLNVCARFSAFYLIPCAGFSSAMPLLTFRVHARNHAADIRFCVFFLSFFFILLNNCTLVNARRWNIHGEFFYMAREVLMHFIRLWCVRTNTHFAHYFDVPMLFIVNLWLWLSLVCRIVLNFDHSAICIASQVLNHLQNK